MDAWCSLWLWAPQHGTEPPSLDQWLSAAEALTRIDEVWEPRALFADEREPSLASSSSLDEILDAHPWLRQARAIAATQNWFHWELEFSPVFARGGFDLQVGNPPWVRPRWSDEDALAEHDPWFGITDPLPEKERAPRRSAVLEDELARAQYVSERAENAGIGDALGAVTREPLLAGQQNNLYLPFITGGWRRTSPNGAVALLHPDGFLSDPKAARLRMAAYRHYREYFHFINELKLFTEISDTRPYGVNVYSGDRGHVDFMQAAFLYHPLVVDRSVTHDGSGELPGRKLATGEWDVRPHRERLVHVDNSTLEAWAALLAYNDAGSTPMVKSVTSGEAAAAEAIARYPLRFGSQQHFWSRGFDEYWSPRQGLLVQETKVPDGWSEVILQGPHFGICTPFAKQPRTSGKHQQDYDAFDLETLPETLVPRTNWQRAVSRQAFEAQIDTWEGKPNTERFRVIARTMIPNNTYRSVFTAIVPPRATTMSGCFVGGCASEWESILFCGVMSGLLADFAARAAGVANLHESAIARFPTMRGDHPLATPLAHRVLRLNALTREFADLWNRNYHVDWADDEFADVTAACTSLVGSRSWWDISIPVRGELDRWLLLAEIDAIGALLLGVGPPELEGVYRSQFPVLLGYEHQMLFDANGRQLCGDWHQHGYLQAQLEAEGRDTRGWVRVWGRVQAYIEGDTDVDLDPFVPPFRPADRVAAMTHAYCTFVERYDLTPPDAPERPA
jgi:hypothetical protein